MFLLNSRTFGRIVKIAQLVLSGIVVTKEVVDFVRNKDEKDD